MAKFNWKKWAKPGIIGLVVASFTGTVATYVKMIPLIGGIGILATAIAAGTLVAGVDYILQKAKF